MMISLQSCLHAGKRFAHRWTVDTRLHRTAQAVLYLLTGFVFSAASLGNYLMPLSLGYLYACSGVGALLAAAGGCLGYWVFWGKAGYMGIFWIGVSLPLAVLLGNKQLIKRTPLLLPMAAALTVAASGVLFQVVLSDMTPITVYLMRVLLAAGTALLFGKIQQGRNAMLDWLGAAFLVFSLAQIVPIPYLGLGYIATGFVAGWGTFPSAVLAGLALDLAQITQLPMTAVLTLGYLVRFLPRHPKYMAAAAPAVVCIAMMGLTGNWDLQPVPGILLGSIAGTYLPIPGKFSHRRGETGVAQVRLEMAAGVLTQTENLLLEISSAPVDEQALMARAAERACGGCACRKNCRDSGRLAQLPPLLLHKPLLSTEELPIVCRKPGRFLAELHRCQEQLRSIRADRQRQKEYRAAVVQQYRFLSSFLQDLADQLPRKVEQAGKVYMPEVTVYGNRQEQDNGDCCLRFSGTGKKYYVLLCDGMGTGMGAVCEGRTAAQMLKRMLCAGYPAEHALRSLNSLFALRDRAGAVSVDMAEVLVDSGKVNLYKWGAAPSYTVTRLGAEKLGTAGPPPGLSVEFEQEQVEHTSLRRGEWLVMVSDGIGEKEALRCCMQRGDSSPGELAVSILSTGQLGSQDDATVVIVRLEA